jgi:malonyl CoA-acyl carrier protein transacylase
MAVYLFSGQGSQKTGMGADLFGQFPDLVKTADEVLGYSIQELCLENPENRLSQTQYTQPALFVVNALIYHGKIDGEGEPKPDFVAGHSLGEYCALYAAGSFDFETGLKLVQKRGALMAEATGGGMAAIIGKTGEEVESLLKASGVDTVDIANYNTYTQVVISGKSEDVQKVGPHLEQAGCMVIPLNVSGAFHSRHMTPARDEFAGFIEQIELLPPQIPVIANYTAKPYVESEIKQNLVEQINHSVRWADSIRYLLDQGESTFVEIGPANILTAMTAKIKRNQ